MVRYMLDTDILVYMPRGLKTPDRHSEARQRAERIRDRIERELRNGATVHVSMVTVCELEYGSERASDPEMVGDAPSLGSYVDIGWAPERRLFRDEADHERFLERLSERAEQFHIRELRRLRTEHCTTHETKE